MCGLGETRVIWGLDRNLHNPGTRSRPPDRSLRPTNQVEEGLVDAGVVGEFGVEGGGQGSSLPDGDRSVVLAFGGDDFDAGADVLNFRSANEDHFQWRASQLFLEESAFADGAVELASVGV